MSDDLLRVYLDPAEIDKHGYPHAWNGYKIIPAQEMTARTQYTVGKIKVPEKREQLPISIKDLIRERDGHRCLRCGHPYRKGEHGNGQWSACIETCTHGGPIRTREAHLGEDAEWREWRGPPPVVAAGEWIYDVGPSGEHIKRWDVEAEWRILTVHHLNGIKHDCRWWNLVSLDQRCHLTIQGKVYMERPWNKPHSEWFKPFAAGFYAWRYLGLELTQEETMARLDELLDLELTQDALFF